MRRAIGFLFLIIVVGGAAYYAQNKEEIRARMDSTYESSTSGVRTEYQEKTRDRSDVARDVLGHEAQVCSATRIIRGNIETFRNRYQRLPSSLEEMIEKQIIEHLPPDPSRRGWTYSPITGDVQHNVYRGC